MSVTEAPRTDPPEGLDPLDPDAVIEEARRHARRRRRRTGAIVVVAVAAAAFAIVGHGRGGAGLGAEPGAGPQAAPAAPPAPTLVFGTPAMHNGPLTVVVQHLRDGSDDGVFTVGAKGVGTPIWRCPGCELPASVAWSPDGTRLAVGATSSRRFTKHDTPPAYRGLDVIDLATKRDVRLTESAFSNPAWSWDGRWLAVDSVTDDTIVLIKADGSQRRTLDPGLRDVRAATWSPDGTRIAFDAHGGIFMMRTDGSHLHRVASDGRTPAWSPLGASIAYTVRCGIRIISPSGVRLASIAPGRPKITEDYRVVGVPGRPSSWGAPVWSPDGRKISMIEGTVSTPHGVWLMNPDGAGAQAPHE